MGVYKRWALLHEKRAEIGFYLGCSGLLNSPRQKSPLSSPCMLKEKMDKTTNDKEVVISTLPSWFLRFPTLFPALLSLSFLFHPVPGVLSSALALPRHTADRSIQNLYSLHYSGHGAFHYPCLLFTSYPMSHHFGTHFTLLFNILTTWPVCSGLVGFINISC